MNKFTIPSLMVLIAVLSIANQAQGEKLAQKDRAFFENKIRPVLVKHCYECHSVDSKEVGGKLLLDSSNGLLKGGESGTALIPSQADKSLLISALKWEGDLQMPPEKPLPQTVINDFEKWINDGAADPRDGSGKVISGKTYEEEAIWSFKSVKNHKVPTVAIKNWPLGSIDNFILSKIESSKLKPTNDAHPETLIRRLYYDLIGLPPSHADVKAFVEECHKDKQKAIRQLVDDLLESNHFGERWGRHWLDVARYSEANGNDGLSRNPTFPHAWRYRDYVISAFNKDTPYDQFLKEQIAGDLLEASSPEEMDRFLIATGFLAMGAKPAKAMNNNFAMDVVADQIDVIGTGIMGISVACARCHDHKFDPIPTRDYYALAGIFTSTETMWGVAGNEKLTAPPTDLHVLKTAEKSLPPKDFVETVILLESNTGLPKKLPKSKWKYGTPLAMGARDKKKPADGKVNIKGDSKKLGDVVPRGFLTACECDDTLNINAKQSGRLELAKWITDKQHPQTARVMVNRIWMHLFGNGIVRTPDDFGVYGERPTHPELLDHLAFRFMENEWSIKQLIRSIVLSRTYQLSSFAKESLIQADQENLLYARHSRRRLDAESLRDSILLVSGQLNPEPAKGSIIQHRDILVNLAGNLHQPSSHRSVYLCYMRSSLPPVLAAFDLPDFLKPIGQRKESTVPGQALHLFNNPFVVEQAGYLARLVMSESRQPETRIRYAWNRVLKREPDSDEVEYAISLLKMIKTESKNELVAWSSFCQGLLATNEFRYVD